MREPTSSNLPTETVSATAAQRDLDSLLDRVSSGVSVTITKKGRPIAVMLPFDVHAALAARPVDPLAALRAELDARFARMQTPEARARVDALFKAGPKELGIAAVKAALRGK